MELAESLARQEIRSIAERYFFGIDTRDPAVVASCFTDKFRFELQLDPVLMLTTPEGIQGLLKGIVQPSATNHALSNMVIELTPDGASSTIHAVAYVSIGEAQRILVRGLRYTDQWVKQRGEWRIANRLHQPRWQYEVPSIPPRGYKPGS